MSVLGIALDPATVIVAVNPGKAFNRVWISNGSGSLVDPMSLPVSGDGISQLEVELGWRGAAEPVFAVEASGEEGSVASGDGRSGYAARRRNLACRPPALGRLRRTRKPADHGD